MTDKRFLVLTVLIGAALTVLFWGSLWTGGGFVGGDIYSYYFPQKIFYADQLHSGEWPFWNNRTGHGYPALGESQTGVFYPLNLLLYSWLDVNTAYGFNHLIHYCLAFVFTAGYARRFGLGQVGALLAGLVYVYGWFPPRSCWEWAILGGTWLPAALWSVECLLQTRRWRYAGLLSLTLAVQLLAGHFQLAWITQLVLVVYVPARLWLVPLATSPSSPRTRVRTGVLLLGAGVLGVLLAAIQLLPTWQFRQVSQRVEVGSDHDLRFGSIPAWYWSQAVQPWKWYSPAMDRTKALQDRPAASGVQANQVEAHLYFGLAPLLLAIVAMGWSLTRGDPRGVFWMLVGIVALFFTTGKLVPLVEEIPGFSYFQGPGRYGIVVTLAVALLAGFTTDRWLMPDRLRPMMAALAGFAACAALLSSWWLVDVAWFVKQGRSAVLPWLPTSTQAALLVVLGLVAVLVGVFCCQAAADRFSDRTRARGRSLVLVAVFLATFADLWLVSRLVQETVVLSRPPIVELPHSQVARLLGDSPEPVRVFAPMANFPTVMGVSSTPVYFTFGPAEYTRKDLSMPHSQVADPDDSFVPQSDRQMEWLQRAGVTHILSFKSIDESRWPVRELWRGRDRLMSALLQKPLYLYELTGGRGRVALTSGHDGNRVKRIVARAGEVQVEVDIGKVDQLVVSELMAPGWQVSVDGKPREAERIEGLYRGVAVEPGDSVVRWHYRPPGLYWGIVLSGMALLVLAGIGHVRFWHPRWLDVLDLEETT